MIPAFNKLSASEVDLMLTAPFLACILIAGADGKIDRKEIRSAIDLATRTVKKTNPALIEYYSHVGEDFEDKFKIVLQSYPSKAAERNPKIAAELGQLNDILSKLDKDFASSFYQSLKEIVHGIAKSSGGFLGMDKVGSEEAKYLKLSMIRDPSQA